MRSGSAGARIALLHVFKAPALRLVMGHFVPKEDCAHYLAETQRDIACDLAAFAASAGLKGIRQIARHEASTPVHEILKTAREERADLIVQSTHSRTGLEKLFIGSVTEKLLGSSTVDVLAIPPLRGR